MSTVLISVDKNGVFAGGGKTTDQSMFHFFCNIIGGLRHAVVANRVIYSCVL